jgi:fimbrial chaperone protein
LKHGLTDVCLSAHDFSFFVISGSCLYNSNVFNPGEIVLKHFLAGLTAFILLFACAPVQANSLSVEPLFVEVTPGSAGAIRVRNTSDKPMSIELFFNERQVSETGIQNRLDAEDAFVLFPPQAVIAPQSLQVFRFQPVLTETSKSQSFYLTVRQLPVQLEPIDGGGTRLQVVFAFDVAVHTTPRGSKADPQFVSAALDTMQIEKAPAADAQPLAPDAKRPKPEFETVPAIAVTLRNDGNKYMYLQDLEYVAIGLDESGKKIEIPSWDVNAIIDAAKVPLLQPGATRTFKLPLRGIPTLKSVDVRIRKRSDG